MSTTAEAAAQKTALDLRYAQVGLLQMKLRSTDPGTILDELTGKLAIAPRFFQQTAVCIDLNELEAEPGVEELRGVIDAIQRGGVKVVGMAEGPASANLARAVDLPVISGFKPQNPPQARPQPSAAPAPPPPPPPQALPALIHTQTVRSGQRVYARERDLIVIGTVGAGAEVMADGCVHVYGALRGRAMAGVRGDTTARVFTQEFRAELVAVAGVFKVFEQLPAELAGHAVQALLAGEELRFARLDA
jgi:septum site-determining protein MinC